MQFCVKKSSWTDFATSGQMGATTQKRKAILWLTRFFLKTSSGYFKHDTVNAFSEQKIGVLYALAAFGFWGFVPVYFKAVQHVQPMEILGHRVLWSVPLTVLLISLSRNWGTLREAISSRKVLFTLFITAVLVTLNWFVFIYAIATDRILQASLGYFINPLVNVLLGMIFLRERLRRPQAAAVLLAAAGTIYLTISHGKLPWISLVLAFSFGVYGLLRKTVRIESVNGLFVETTIICPLALFYLLFRGVQGTGAFLAVDWQTTILLVAAGAVTTFPLVWFTSAARRLQYATIGILQYLAPSLNFLLAVFCYHEAFTPVYIASFACIWTGLAIFVMDSIKTARQ